MDEKKISNELSTWMVNSISTIWPILKMSKQFTEYLNITPPFTIIFLAWNILHFFFLFLRIKSALNLRTQNVYSRHLLQAKWKKKSDQGIQYLDVAYALTI